MIYAWKMDGCNKDPVRTEKGRPRIVKGGSSEFAYHALRREIVELTLTPGATLDEGALVGRLGLSRTPVREALVRLAAEGLVQLLPNRGARVAGMGWNDIREHLEAFDVMQRLVTRWAALRRTEAGLAAIDRERTLFEGLVQAGDAARMIDYNWRFHAVIAANCGNNQMQRFYLQLLTDNLRISRLAMTLECFHTEAGYLAHVQTIVHEHAGMVQAIRAQNADHAEALARSHTDLARKRVAETLTQSLPAAAEIVLDPSADVLDRRSGREI